MRSIPWPTMLFAALLPAAVWAADRSKLSVTFLELRTHGLACVVETPDRSVYLLDTGGSSAEYDAGRDTIGPYLTAKGVREIAGIVISHPHGDHYGGAPWLLANFPVKQFIDSGYQGISSAEEHRRQMEAYQAVRDLAKSRGVAYRAVHAGDQLDWGPELSAEVLSPPRDYFLQGADPAKHSTHAVLNANSLVLRLQFGKHVFLFPGDAYGAIGEYLLQQPREKLITTVLAAPHHGFNPGSFPELCRPEVVVASSLADYPGNAHLSYPRAPGDHATSIFGKVGSQVWTTARHGTVQVITDGQKYAVEVARPTLSPPDLRIHWEQNFLTIRGKFPGEAIRVNYLEAFCRAGSTDRDWRETVIPHQTELVSASEDQKRVQLKSVLEDGVEVLHDIVSLGDAIDFRIKATNPTQQKSAAYWAQPCIRLDPFLGVAPVPSSETYLPQSFVFLDGQLTRMPTPSWAKHARYTPGQVWAPRHVDRNDVNPRPLNDKVPSNGLIGCFSRDEQWVFATAFEPYQELFQGVIVCLHSDFRIGGLEPGETKQIRGKIYLTPNDIPALLRRYEQDFPEQQPSRR